MYTKPDTEIQPGDHLILAGPTPLIEKCSALYRNLGGALFGNAGQTLRPFATRSWLNSGGIPPIDIKTSCL